ncbi:MAG TPA: T9SS type A sorting domain-containing protein [Crocinitomicaceae bacterium]|nr:T9SS type A sorting domain-containing protein [Crocinitomicaceae bacterium]
MKKNLLLVLGLGVTFGASAQVGTKHSLKFENKPANKVEDFGAYHNFAKNNNFTAKAGGDVIWSDDFTDISAAGTNWVIDNNGQTAADIGWATVTTSRKWYSTINNKINSTSGGKFLEVMNGKYSPATSATNIIFTATSPAITVPSTDVTVKFLQYGAIFNDSQSMEVSADGNSWTEIFTNNERTTYNGGNPAAIYANPELVEANVGLAGLPSGTTTIYLRFKFTSRFASESNPIAWLTFGWMIDDLEVVENYSNDLKNLDPFVSSAGIRYSMIPAAQGHEIALVNTVLNNGSAALNDVASYVNITTPSSTYGDTAMSMINPLPAYVSDTIVHSLQLSDLGTYSIAGFGSYFDGTDEVTTNDESNYTYSFDFGGTIYALDLGGTPTSYDSEQDNADYHVGNVFDMYADAKLTGIDFYPYASGNLKSTVGTEVFAAIRDYGDGMPVISRTENYSLGAGDNNKWLTLVFDEPVDLTEGKTYVATVGCYGSGDVTSGAIDLVIGMSGYSLRGSSLSYYGSSSTSNWYIAGSGGTPMVRMNFTPDIVSTKNLNESVKVNIYPNPAKDKAVVDYNTAFAGDVTISVVDLSGRTVYTNTFANQAAGNNKVELNVADFNAGVYQVVINANSATITKKLVIK